MKKLFLLVVLFLTNICFSQSEKGSKQFWEKLKMHCGKSFEGQITAGA
jgi:hypothetical protein